MKAKKQGGCKFLYFFYSWSPLKEFTHELHIKDYNFFSLLGLASKKVSKQSRGQSGYGVFNVTDNSKVYGLPPTHVR